MRLRAFLSSLLVASAAMAPVHSAMSAEPGGPTERVTVSKPRDPKTFRPTALTARLAAARSAVAPAAPAVAPAEAQAPAHTGSVPDPAADALSLRGALDVALERDPYTLAALADVEVANREIWRERAKYAPTVTATLSADLDRTGSVSLSDNGSDGYGAIEASLKLFDGGVRRFGVRAAEARRDAAVYDAMTEKGRTTLKLVDAWSASITGAEELRIAHASVGRLKKLRAAVAARRDGGFASASDVALIEADIASAEQNATTTEAALEKSRAAAQRLAGRLPAKDAKLPSFSGPLKIGKEALREHAHRTNPSLRAAASRYQSEVYASRSAFARHLPQVELTAQYRFNLDDGAATATNDDEMRIGARLRIPLLDLTTVADTAVQSARLEASLQREAIALHDVESEIDTLWSDWKAVGAMGRQAEAEAQMRRKVAKASRERFENGFGSLEEAVRAEAALADAERLTLQVRARESQTGAQLLIVSGLFRPDHLD